ncbi:hypothetical protein [Streptomyces boninensis]|uniref:hypothetical protein n=1 Tax=Streptomyces boninensis TaxID=2039455 RepID=UPI003B225ED3
MSTAQTVVITGASSGFGNLTARALARAGHTVYDRVRAEFYHRIGIQELLPEHAAL